MTLIASRQSRRRALVRIGLVVSLLLPAACSPGRDLAPLPEYKATAYHLGSGDQIRIITFGEEQLTGTFRVDDEGRVALPLLGAVSGAGSTTRQLEVIIASQLRKRKLLSDPSVSVEVVAYRPIFVLGEVAKPGQYPFQPGMTMLTSVAVAGGFSYRAFQAYAEVIRTTQDVPEDGLVNPSSLIAPGDVIKVFERRF